MKLYGLLALVILIVAIIVGSFLGGLFYERNSQASEKVDSIVILNKIENEATILTKTVYLNQESIITIDQGSEWSNFWWGQTITANGLMKVSVGVDYKKITQNDITIDNVAKKITITLPEAEVLNVTIDGDIQVTNKTGILKLIFDNDTNGDYNRAMQQLTADAKATVEMDETLMSEAREDSVKVIEMVLKDTGYTVAF